MIKAVDKEGQEVEAIQYQKGMAFQDRYWMLKWFGKLGASVTIYGDCLVVDRPDEGKVKIVFGDWFFKVPDGRVGICPEGIFNRDYTKPGNVPDSCDLCEFTDGCCGNCPCCPH